MPAPSRSEQRRAVDRLSREGIYADGCIFALVHVKWHERWLGYISGDTMQMAPGSVNNEPLLDADKNLREDVAERDDFILVPEAVYDKLTEWYGGGPKIARTCITVGINKDETVVELRPPRFIVQNGGKSTQITVSKLATVKELRQKASEAIKMSEADAAPLLLVADCDGAESMKLDKGDVTVEEALLINGQRLRFERTDKRGVSPPKPTSPVAYMGTLYKPLMHTLRDTAVSSTRTAGGNLGICGLSNLGNTCFMNSALQCLSATGALREFFLNKQFELEINVRNPIGMKGEIAKAFGELLQNMWSGKTLFTPRELKFVVGKFAPRFSGFVQHDAQEFLAFFLDGLHEDLNRVQDKPYVPTPPEEVTQRPDSEVAGEAWDRHLKRNRSIIVDLFHAQLKSTVRCPDCLLVSRTFDPFMYLSLPLPSTRTVSFDVIVDMEEKGHTKFLVTVPVTGTVSHIKAELCNLMNVSPPISPAQIIIAEMTKNCITLVWADARGISELPRGGRLFAYITSQKVAALGVNKAKSVQIIQRVKAGAVQPLGDVWKTFAMPALRYLLSDTTAIDLYSSLLARYSRILLQPHEYGPDGPFPFSLSFVDAKGTQCTACKSINCSGCPLQPNTKLVQLPEHGSLSLDWNPLAKRNTEEENKTRIDSSCKKNIAQESKVLTLQHCLNLFCNTEQLGPQDSWYCPKCKAHRQAYKKMELYSSTAYLVIHLKRFAFSQSMRNKIDTLVEFPVEGLNLAPLLQNGAPNGPELYDLYAVSNHIGGLGGGHYTAYVKSSSGSWYLMNDSGATQVKDIRELQTSNAYLLFYARRSHAPTTHNGQDALDEKLETDLALKRRKGEE